MGLLVLLRPFCNWNYSVLTLRARTMYAGLLNPFEETQYISGGKGQVGEEPN